MGRKRLKGRWESKTQFIRKGDNGERGLSMEISGSVRQIFDSERLCLRCIR